MTEEFQMLVDAHYQGLFRFALSLSQRNAEAEDLTQQTFMRWAEKGHQLRERNKAKTWLYTTLYREFLGGQRRATRFPHSEIGEVEHELPAVDAAVVQHMDASAVMEALNDLDEVYRAPLTLFYLRDHSYQEIAEVLDVPIGTVMSRLSRGKEQLKKRLREHASGPRGEEIDNVISFDQERRKVSNG